LNTPWYHDDTATALPPASVAEIFTLSASISPRVNPHVPAGVGSAKVYVVVTDTAPPVPTLR
jgi:hypothetical protein